MVVGGLGRFCTEDASTTHTGPGGDDDDEDDCYVFIPRVRSNAECVQVVDSNNAAAVLRHEGGEGVLWDRAP